MRQSGNASAVLHRHGIRPNSPSLSPSEGVRGFIPTRNYIVPPHGRVEPISLVLNIKNSNMPNGHKTFLYIFHIRAKMRSAGSVSEANRSGGGRFSVGIVEYNKGHGLTLSGFGGLVGYHIDRPPFRASCGRFWGRGGHGRRSGFPRRTALRRQGRDYLPRDGQKCP